MPCSLHTPSPQKHWRNNSKGQLCKKSLDKLCSSSQWCIESFHPGQSPQQIIKEVTNIRDWKCCWVFNGWPIWVTDKLLYLQHFGWKGTQFLFYSQREGLSWDYACFLNRPEPFKKKPKPRQKHQITTTSKKKKPTKKTPEQENHPTKVLEKTVFSHATTPCMSLVSFSSRREFKL